MKASEIILNSGVSFGTSGARGLVKNLSDQVCAAFTLAFLDVMKDKFRFDTVAIAIDNRPSSQQIAKACAQAAQQADVDVIYFGVVPTPALALLSIHNSIPAIMVTGSHIPFDRNGLKFYRPDGEIDKQDEVSILESNVSVEIVNSVLPTLTVSEHASKLYIDRNTSIFPGKPLSEMRIGVYQHSSAGRDLYPLIFSALGAEVILLEPSDTFVPVDTEAVGKEERIKAKLWSSKHNLDAIFTTDGDGDRPMLSDENGEWLRGDILGFLCAKALGIEAVAIPISCNTSIKTSGIFPHTSQTKIGSPYIIAEINKLKKKFKRIAGFEANGGFILGSDISWGNSYLTALPTRDAILPALVVLIHATHKSAKISDLLKTLPQRYTSSDRIQNVNNDNVQKLLELGVSEPQTLVDSWGIGSVYVDKVDNTDGLRMYINNGDIIHIRPSGNAPELRCYSESSTQIRADWLVQHVLSAISF